MPVEPVFDDDDDDAAGLPNVPAGVAAWVLPGLGHILRGEPRRGRLIMFGVLFLVLTGLLVGGVDCVDRKRDRLWFLAQAVCGPIAFAADFLNQGYVQKLPDEERFPAIALNKPNEMGTLFVALAGLMNLVVILDAAFSRRRSEFIDRRGRRGKSQEPMPRRAAASIMPSNSEPVS
jgi:hypothetical protein